MSSPARERVEQGIWKRVSAAGTRYEITYRDSDGRQRRQVVEGGLKAARVALHKVKADIGSGVRVAPAPQLTFDAAADEWWASKSESLRPATRSAYANGLAHLRRELGPRRLDAITPAAVAGFVASQRAAGYRGWTIRGQLVVLRQVMAFARRRLGFTGGDPVALLERGERPSTADEKAKRVLAPDELRRLLDAIPERYRLVFELIAETGARKGEALGLVWSEIDLADASLTFTHQLDRHGRRVPLKTEASRRVIEITPALTRKLRAAKLASPASGPYDLAFTTRTGTPHDPRNILRVLAAACTRAGLEAVKDYHGEVVEPAPTVHALRHTHGSALIAAGWDLKEVSTRLGHSDVETTLRVYTHDYDAARRSDARRDRLAALYGPEPAAMNNVTALPAR